MAEVIHLVICQQFFKMNPSRTCRKVLCSIHACILNFFDKHRKYWKHAHGKFCKISMQPAKSSEQIHVHLKKYGSRLENVWKKLLSRIYHIASNGASTAGILSEWWLGSFESLGKFYLIRQITVDCVCFLEALDSPKLFSN